MSRLRKSGALPPLLTPTCLHGAHLIILISLFGHFTTIYQITGFVETIYPMNDMERMRKEDVVAYFKLLNGDVR